MEDGMEQAIKSITLRGMSVREAADQYNISKSTIYDRLSGKVLPNMSCGAHKYLTDNEKRELAKFLIGCSKIGYGKTRSEVLLLVERLLQSCGITRTVSNGWWERFRMGHPDVTHHLFAKLELYQPTMKLLISILIFLRKHLW